MTDATPVPCAASGGDGQAFGAGRARWLRLLRLAFPLLLGVQALPGLRRGRHAGHVVPGNPKIGEREVVAALLEHNHYLIRTGQILLADKGFAGAEFKQLTEDMGLTLLRPDRRDETDTNGNLGGMRQWIESVNQTLKGQLDLERHGGRTLAGVFTRIAQ